MVFQTPLLRATLIRRYKRFLADVRLEDGTEVTAHCANPGSMLGLAEPGLRVWVEPNNDPRKKLRYGLRLVDVGGALVGVDTSLPNRVVGDGLRAGAIDALSAYTRIRPEVRYGEKSRVDFLCQGDGLRDAYVEVKSVTLSRSPGLAEFPDSRTDRGARHLGELANVAGDGARAVLVYLVQRSDAFCMTLAADIDPAYADASTKAQAAGVEILVLGTKITPQGITLGQPLPFDPIAALAFDANLP
jgi:sugar fermentation stimulation protein A